MTDKRLATTYVISFFALREKNLARFFFAPLLDYEIVVTAKFSFFTVLYFPEQKRMEAVVADGLKKAINLFKDHKGWMNLRSLE